MTTSTITAADLPPDWISARREIATRDGHALRAGRGNTIEVQSINTGEWLTLQLPDNARNFATAADRDAVLRHIQGYKTC